MNRSTSRLLDRRRSCLAVIDVQQVFLDKLPLDQRARLVGRIAWLIRVAVALDIPLLATAEDIARVGPVVPEIASLLPAAAPAHDKMVFDLCQQPAIRAAVAATGRDQFVLAGLETDVCVTHSAFGLMAAGHEVAVALDAFVVRLVLLPVVLRFGRHHVWHRPSWLNAVLPHVRFTH